MSGAHLALLAVCILHALSPILFRGLHAGFGWDETVYISQIDPHAPATYFDAPRARGLTLLTAPASLVSGSIAVMRVWLAILSAAGMFLAFLPWLRLRRGPVVPMAAALFSTLWVAIYYSFEAMPNQYVGYGALAATGWLITGLRESGRRRDLLYCALAIAFTALMRPTDAMFLLVPMLVAVGFATGLSRRRRTTVAALITAGYLAGIAEWIIEAYVRFGGPLHRFTAASQENTGGIHWSLGAEFRSLGGPILCRDGCVPSSPVSTELWWFALVPLVIVGLVAAAKAGRLRSYGLATAAGLSLAMQYFVFVGYPAPRFLEPTYLLLALPVAEAVVYPARRLAPAARPAAVTAMVVVLGFAEVPQLRALHDASVPANQLWSQYAGVASYLHRQGIEAPCYLAGANQTVISFAAACHDIPAQRQEVRTILATTDASVAFASDEPITRALATGDPHRLVAAPVRLHGYWVAIVRPRPGVDQRPAQRARSSRDHKLRLHASGQSRTVR